MCRLFAAGLTVNHKIPRGSRHWGCRQRNRCGCLPSGKNRQNYLTDQYKKSEWQSTFSYFNLVYFLRVKMHFIFYYHNWIVITISLVNLQIFVLFLTMVEISYIKHQVSYHEYLSYCITIPYQDGRVSHYYKSWSYNTRWMDLIFEVWFLQFGSENFNYCKKHPHYDKETSSLWQETVMIVKIRFPPSTGKWLNTCYCGTTHQPHYFSLFWPPWPHLWHTHTLSSKVYPPL